MIRLHELINVLQAAEAKRPGILCNVWIEDRKTGHSMKDNGVERPEVAHQRDAQFDDWWCITFQGVRDDMDV